MISYILLHKVNVLRHMMYKLILFFEKENKRIKRIILRKKKKKKKKGIPEEQDKQVCGHILH